MGLPFILRPTLPSLYYTNAANKPAQAPTTHPSTLMPVGSAALLEVVDVAEVVVTEAEVAKLLVEPDKVPLGITGEVIVVAPDVMVTTGVEVVSDVDSVMEMVVGDERVIDDDSTVDAVVETGSEIEEKPEVPTEKEGPLLLVL